MGAPLSSDEAGPLRLSVRKKNQSGGDFIVFYDADVVLRDAPGVDVSVAAGAIRDPAGFGEKLVTRDFEEIAAPGIRSGAAAVLAPRGRGATIVVTYLLHHAVDLRRGEFERHTAHALTVLLEAPDG